MTVKLMKRAIVVLAVASLVACVAHQPNPAFKPVDLSPKAKSGEIVRKADNFMIIMDSSQSMAGSEVFKGESRFDRAWDIVARINETLPNVGFMAALRSAGTTICPFGRNKSRLFFGPARWDREDFKEAMENAIFSKGRTPLADAIAKSASDLSYAKGAVAVIIISDGMNNIGDPVAAAKKMKAAFGDRLCISAIQIGSEPAGKRLLSSIVEIGGCGTLESEENLVAADGVADFVQKVFFSPAG